MTEHTDAEKAAEEWAKSYAYMMPNTNLCKERVLAAQEEGFLAGAAWAESKWISVKERLPEVDELVMLCDSYMGYWWGHVNSFGDFVYRFGNGQVTNTGKMFTHWMPLPAAPKEEK